MFIESYQDDLTLLSFFDSEPILADNLDRHFTYEFTDKNNVALII